MSPTFKITPYTSSAKRHCMSRVCSSTRPSYWWGIPGIEPGTSRTLSENHAARPNPQAIRVTAQWLGCTGSSRSGLKQDASWTWNKYMSHLNLNKTKVQAKWLSQITQPTSTLRQKDMTANSCLESNTPIWVMGDSGDRTRDLSHPKRESCR